MKKINYFLDTDNDLLLAYERESEFFVRFLKDAGEWEDCPISFSAFRQDYAFRELSREDASRLTGGKLPEEMLDGYLRMLEQNRRG